MAFGSALLMLSAFSLLALEVPASLQNLGFEEENPAVSGLPLHWSSAMSPPQESANGQETKGVIKRDKTQFHSGEASVFIRTEGPRYARLSQAVELIPGAKYKLGVWVKIPNLDVAKAGSINISVSGRLKDKTRWAFAEPLDRAAGSTEWTRLVLEFTVPPESVGESSISLRTLFLKGPVEAWFDDVEFTQLD